MITASALLAHFPDLPSTAQDILRRLVAAGDPEIHLPGLPTLPSALAPLTDALKTVVVEALGKFDFEFYQTIGVRIRFAESGVALGGAGAKFNEVLNLANAVPNVKITPIIELGDPSK